MSQNNPPLPPNASHPRPRPPRPAQAMETKAPPNAEEMEAALVGAILLQPDLVHQISPLLQPSEMYSPRLSLLYQTQLTLAREGVAPDLFAVLDRIKTQGHIKEGEEPQWMAQLSELEISAAPAASLPYFAQVVRDKSDLRRLIHLCRDIAEEAHHTTDTPAFLAQSEQSVYDLRQHRDVNEIVHSKGIVQEVFARMEARWGKGEPIVGVPTGFEEFDKITAGLQPSDLIILAARPAMGKTSLATNIAFYAGTVHQKKVAIFSTEMSKEQVIQRMISCEGRVTMTQMRTAEIREDQIPRLFEAAQSVSNCPLFINDEAKPTPFQIASICRRLAATEGLDLIIVDYLQRMGSDAPRRHDREGEIREIAEGLKTLAKQLNVPVLALAQLNRSLEKRPDKRPVLADLRESGAIEQEADLVTFLYRDEVYHPDTPDQGVAEWIIGKNRHGPLGGVRLGFDGQYTRFTNLMGVSKEWRN